MFLRRGRGREEEELREGGTGVWLSHLHLLVQCECGWSQLEQVSADEVVCTAALQKGGCGYSETSLDRTTRIRDTSLTRTLSAIPTT